MSEDDEDDVILIISIIFCAILVYWCWINYSYCYPLFNLTENINHCATERIFFVRY